MPGATSHKRHDSPEAVEPAKKRRRGAARLSCAECRRLKLRCDRTIPCGSCVKRGCGAICPDGSLTTGQGNRFVLASTQELHEKITELCGRVRELEDALRDAHSKQSSNEHPLLSEEHLRIKVPVQNIATLRGPAAINQQEGEDSQDIVDSFGTLCIARTGFANYHSHSANSWYFLQNEEESCRITPSDPFVQQLRTLLPDDILRTASSFPVSSTSLVASVSESCLSHLHWYLPPSSRASELRDIFYTYAAWLHVPIPLEDFNDDILSPIYGSLPSKPSQAGLSAPYSHQLSILFMVLAIGSLMDTRLPAFNVDAEKYNQLGRAALFQNNLFDDEPTVEAVQALFMMSFYLFLADRHGSRIGSRWAISGLATKLAHSIGLHRDASRWKLDKEDIKRRCDLFWELYVFDNWQCLTFGRPPSFTSSQVDCRIPDNQESESVEETFHTWKYRFSSECMTIIHDQAFGAKAPAYSTILQLDRKLRAMSVPSVLQIVGFGNAPLTDSRSSTHFETASLILQRHIVLAIREINLLYMHRGFFAQALIDRPNDPLGSQYGSSVIAAYRSAGALIALVRNLHSQLKDIAERMWFLWTHVFSCAIVLGCIVTRSPSLSLAPSALVQLDSACDLFAKAAHGFHAEKILARMVNLQEKAHASIKNHREGNETLQARTSLGSSPVSIPDLDDDLTELGGRTRFISTPTSSPKSPEALSGQSTLPLHPAIPFPIKNFQEPMHPSVVEYLKSFTSSQEDTLPAPGVKPLMTNPAQQRPEPTAHHHADMYTFSVDISNGVMPGSSAYPSPATSSSYPETPTSMATLGTLDALPAHFPIFDYGGSADAHITTSLFSPVEMLNGDGHGKPDGVDGSTGGSWQEFVSQFGLAA